MRTVKQVSKLTGISVRTLQYYDEIGILKPTKLTDSGYRLYDDAAMELLQQILFFKELDFSLKEIKAIMEKPEFDKKAAYKQQKRLLLCKRDRLNRLIGLLEKLEQGETSMSFEEFDMSCYFEMLSEFRKDHADCVVQGFGSVEAFDEWVEKLQETGPKLAESAMQNYGSVEAFTEAMKVNLENMPKVMERGKELKEAGGLDKIQEWTQFVLQDLTKDPGSEEIQNIIKELVEMTEKLYDGMQIGENMWDRMIEDYLHNDLMIKTLDAQYGQGASAFIGKAYQCYFKRS